MSDLRRALSIALFGSLSFGCGGPSDPSEPSPGEQTRATPGVVPTGNANRDDPRDDGLRRDHDGSGIDTDARDASVDDEGHDGTTGYVPSPEEIDAMLADPRLHQGLAPTDQAFAPPPPKETVPEPPKTNPARRKFAAQLLDALAQSDDAAISALTPLGSPELRALCPGVEVEKKALEARIRHCVKAFEWNHVVDARVNGGEPTADTIAGCNDDIRAMGRVRVQIETKGGRHDAELRDAFGRDGEILGFLGTLTCIER